MVSKLKLISAGGKKNDLFFGVRGGVCTTIVMFARGARRKEKGLCYAGLRVSLHGGPDLLPVLILGPTVYILMRYYNTVVQQEQQDELAAFTEAFDWNASQLWIMGRAANRRPVQKQIFFNDLQRKTYCSHC